MFLLKYYNSLLLINYSIYFIIKNNNFVLSFLRKEIGDFEANDLNTARKQKEYISKNIPNENKTIAH